jgi:hypothetical protein
VNSAECGASLACFAYYNPRPSAENDRSGVNNIRELTKHLNLEEW